MNKESKYLFTSYNDTHELVVAIKESPCFTRGMHLAPPMYSANTTMVMDKPAFKHEIDLEHQLEYFRPFRSLVLFSI